jgi:NNP family nitrate/nitrite transporter-like MFS transporter
MVTITRLDPRPIVPNELAPARSVLLTATMLAALALTGGAWMLGGLSIVEARQRGEISPGTGLLLVVAPLVVGCLGAVPLGAFTDRVGVRVMSPVVSAATAAGLVVAGIGSAPALLAAACLLGIGGTAFVVGARAVAHGPASRHGFRLSLLGVALVGGALAMALLAELWQPSVYRARLQDMAGVCAALLLVVPTLAMLVFRDAPAGSASTLTREAAGLFRLPVIRQVSVLFALTTAGLLAMVLYLPPYLHSTGFVAIPNVTLFAVVAATAGAVGGWRAGWRGPRRLMVVCYGSAAALGALVAFVPRLTTVAVVGVAGAAALLGTAGGALLGVLGRTMPARHTGVIVGTVVAAACGASLVPLLLDVAHSGFATNGPMLLAGLALAAAVYLHTRADTLAFPLPWRSTLATDSPLTVVVALAPGGTDADDPALLTTLVDLARCHELVVVCGPWTTPTKRMSVHQLITAMRARLPRQAIVGVLVDEPKTAPEFAIIAELVVEGTIPVAVVTATDPTPTATLLASHLGAEVVLRLDCHDDAERTSRSVRRWPAGTGQRRSPARP